MAYTINKSDGTVLATVADANINTTASSIALVGRRSTNYGELIAENMVHLMENFANSVAPTAPIQGQFWYDTTAGALKFYNSGTWGILFTFSGGNASVTTSQLTSTVSTGTAPIVVASTTKVTNLNADLLDGFDTSQAAVANTVAVRNSSADLYANLFQGTATSAKYADVAERFEASEPLEPGDIVEIGGDKEIIKASGASALGVISTNPALRMNDGAGDDNSHPFVAFVGRVPCKITGPAKKGDRIMISGVAGVGIVADPFGTQTQIIGRALEDKTDDGVGKVMIVVGVK
jgi:hypothetical protein